MYHFINLKIVYHSNRAVLLFVLVRDCDSLGSKETDTNDAGDDHRYTGEKRFLFHGDLEAKTFPAIPHMTHEMAWFNVSNRTSAAL